MQVSLLALVFSAGYSAVVGAGFEEKRFLSGTLQREILSC